MWIEWVTLVHQRTNYPGLVVSERKKASDTDFHWTIQKISIHQGMPSEIRSEIHLTLCQICYLFSIGHGLGRGNLWFQQLSLQTLHITHYTENYIFYHCLWNCSCDFIYSLDVCFSCYIDPADNRIFKIKNSFLVITLFISFIFSSRTAITSSSFFFSLMIHCSISFGAKGFPDLRKFSNLL